MITMYSKNDCAHCASAKQFLENRNINFNVVNIDHDPAAREFVVSRGHRSLPQFYVGSQQLISGGWDQLRRLTADDIMDTVLKINNLNNLGSL